MGDEMSVPHVPHVDQDEDEAQLWAMRCLYHMWQLLRSGGSGVDCAQILAEWGMDEMEIYTEVYIYMVYTETYMVYAGKKLEIYVEWQKCVWGEVSLSISISCTSESPHLTPHNYLTKSNPNILLGLDSILGKMTKSNNCQL